MRSCGRPRCCPTSSSCWRDGGTTVRRTSCARPRPPNVTLTGWVEEDVLNDCYRRASVYVQASAHEGFGLSVAEAMLAGCIPVTTRAGALPEVVGDIGVQVDGQDPAQLAAAIERALERDDHERARRRASACSSSFPLEMRRAGVQALVTEALDRAAEPRGDDGQPLQRHADAPDRGDAARDGAGGGRRRAALRRPDRERAAGARRGAARQGGGAASCRRARCATRSRSGCTCGPAATR